MTDKYVPELNDSTFPYNLLLLIYLKNDLNLMLQG